MGLVADCKISHKISSSIVASHCLNIYMLFFIIIFLTPMTEHQFGFGCLHPDLVLYELT